MKCIARTGKKMAARLLLLPPPLPLMPLLQMGRQWPPSHQGWWTICLVSEFHADRASRCHAGNRQRLPTVAFGLVAPLHTRCQWPVPLLSLMPTDISFPLGSASSVGDERRAESLRCAPFIGVPSPFGGAEAQAMLYPCRSVH